MVYSKYPKMLQVWGFRPHGPQLGDSCIVSPHQRKSASHLIQLLARRKDIPSFTALPSVQVVVNVYLSLSLNRAVYRDLLYTALSLKGTQRHPFSFLRYDSLNKPTSVLMHTLRSLKVLSNLCNEQLVYILYEIMT